MCSTLDGTKDTYLCDNSDDEKKNGDMEHMMYCFMRGKLGKRKRKSVTDSEPFSFLGDLNCH